MRQDKDITSLEFRSARPYGVPVSGEQEELDIDIRGLALKLWRGKRIILISTFITLLLGLLVVSQFEPTYTARTKVMFDISETNVVDVGQAVVRLDDTLQNQVEVLQSTALIERVISELNLARNPEFNPSLRPPETGLVPALGTSLAAPVEAVRARLRDLGIVSPLPPPPDAEEVAALLRLSIIDQIRRQMRLAPIPDTKVIEIGFTSGDPRLSTRIANTLAQQYIVDQLDAKLEATREATSWLSDRVEELRLRVQTAEEAVEAARADLAQGSGQGLEITQAQLEALNAELSSARAQLTQSEATYARLQEALDTNRDLGAVNEFRASSLIQSYRDEEALLVSQRATLANTVAEDHPARLRVESQLAEVRETMRAEAGRIVEAARLALSAAEDRVTALQAELETLESRVLQQSQGAVRIRQLEREAEASRVLYENFLGRLKETSEQEALQSADARVLSPAEIPLYADAQRRTRTLALAVLLGLAGGVGLVLLLDKLNNTFRSPAQLEDLSGETFLGALPAIGRRLHRRDVIRAFRENPKSALAEATRNLRTSILFSNLDDPPRTIMFTSSVPREGKSTTSMLMALTSQQMGKSAVIVDCDLRLPSLARLLPEAAEGPGLLSVLSEAAPLDNAIHRDATTGLDVLMTKPHEPRSTVNAADILSSHRFHNLIETLKERYDLVILDTPPTLVVTDARILARNVDAVIYVVKWDDTPRGAVLEGLKELRAVKAPIIGVSFTMLNEKRASKYTYDGYSYYRGRYQDYYVS